MADGALTMGELTFSSTFTGGGVGDMGALAAGLVPRWGVEIDPAAAEVAARNLRHDVIARDIADVDFRRMEPTFAHISTPPCQGDSSARSRKLPPRFDLHIGEQVIRVIRDLRPTLFVLENVPRYIHNKAFFAIHNALTAAGYFVHVAIVNAADFGVPQTRKRLLLRARLDGFPRPLPPPVPWRGWYEAVADLIATLPDSPFGEWQIRRLPPSLGFSALVGTNSKDCESRELSLRSKVEPATTVTTSSGGRLRAFLVDGCNARELSYSGLTVSPDRQPGYTITASSDKHVHRAWLDSGRTVALTPRALARLQTLPDSYELPEGKGTNRLASRIIGNGAPSEMIRRIIANEV